MDLAWNSLTSWSEIRAILSLPKLEALNLGYNPLQAPLLEATIPVTANLELLILNGTNLPMSGVRDLVTKMPKLRELHLSENRYVVIAIFHVCPIT